MRGSPLDFYGFLARQASLYPGSIQIGTRVLNEG